jgi:2-polyprenyl-3-methyl-5-hydroxy-6-metoxy-1,4-benzoquinol methylase
MKPLDRFLQRWRIRKALPQIQSGDRLLDIGCFDRSLIDQSLNRIASAVGVDTNIESMNTDRVELRRGRFPEEVDFEPESFECVTALAVLEHVEDPEGFAVACERVLVPGGRVVLTVPHPFVDRILELLIALRLVDGVAAHEHHGFDVERTQPIFASAGLSLSLYAPFQLGLNRLYVFEKAGPRRPAPRASDRP